MARIYLDIEVPFAEEWKCSIFENIITELSTVNRDGCTVTCNREGNAILMTFTAESVKDMRITINSYIHWVDMILKIFTV